MKYLFSFFGTVQVGPSVRNGYGSAVGQFSDAQIFKKSAFANFLKKCFERDGTERVCRDGTGRKRYCNQSDGKDIVIRKIW